MEAVLSVNNMVEFNSREQMKHLLKYPYGCLEQSTSSTYPWLYANDDILASLDLKNASNKNRLQSINHGLSRIQAKALKKWQLWFMEQYQPRRTLVNRLRWGFLN